MNTFLLKSSYKSKPTSAEPFSKLICKLVKTYEGKFYSTQKPISRIKNIVHQHEHRPYSQAKTESSSSIDSSNKIMFMSETKASPSVSTGMIREARLIQIRLVKNMTANGKISSYSAAVVAGNGAGGIGFGMGRDKQTVDAITKATAAAEKNMEFFERYENRTLFHDVQVKFKATVLIVRTVPPETGRRCHWAIQEMCRCMGIKDLSAKVYGSRDPINVVRAFLLALKRQKTPQQVAFDSGMKIEDVLKIYQYGHSYTGEKK